MTAPPDPLREAARHPLVHRGPAPGFFEGALLGNGGLGAVVTTRPDAVVIRFGHNAVWDIRLSEPDPAAIGTFQAVFDRLQAKPRDEAWVQAHVALTSASYALPHPRPMPCGSLLLGFDRRRTEVLGHRVDIATGLCTVELAHDGQALALRLVVDPEADRLWFAVIGVDGQAAASPFWRVRLLPDPRTPAAFSRPVSAVDAACGLLAFRQVLPFAVEGSQAGPDPRDRAFALTLQLGLGVGLRAAAATELAGDLEPGRDLCGWVGLEHGPAADVGLPGPDPVPLAGRVADALDRAEVHWAAFWSRSGILLDDPVLERTWYHNLYFFHCATRAGVTCPGLFANWSHGDIGSAWHGDYHLNYNTQQPFWVAFSSNHLEGHLPYVELVEHLLPVSRRWARDYYGLRGACFPHSAYPVEMHLPPYPVPHWGWEICETPWAVQSLWWHYLYSGDVTFLRERAIGPIREAVRFLADYLQRPEAHGPAWGDDRFHVFPTAVPELYPLDPDLKRSADCLADLTLIRFVFAAYLRALAVVGQEAGDEALAGEVAFLLERLPAPAQGLSSRGPVFLSVAGEDPEVVYNVPVSLMTVFPGEEHGLHSPPADLQTAANTYRNARNEGGNELVFMNLVGARLGLLDLDRFRRQIEYCRMPNGTCSDRVLQAGGRYADVTDFGFMDHMGVWFENFALPAVINECLLQSYDGTLRLFPNWPLDRPAAFTTLRAAGAFLVSAACADGAVISIEITSEIGGPLTLDCPWPRGARCGGDRRAETVCSGPVIRIETAPGERLHLRPA